MLSETQGQAPQNVNKLPTFTIDFEYKISPSRSTAKLNVKSLTRDIPTSSTFIPSKLHLLLSRYTKRKFRVWLSIERACKYSRNSKELGDLCPEFTSSSNLRRAVSIPSPVSGRMKQRLLDHIGLTQARSKSI